MTPPDVSTTTPEMEDVMPPPCANAKALISERYSITESNLVAHNFIWETP
jgi:hypothetical protein